MIRKLPIILVIVSALFATALFVTPTGLMQTTMTMRPNRQTQTATYADYQLYSTHDYGFQWSEQAYDATGTTGAPSEYTYIVGCIGESDSTAYTDVFIAKINGIGDIVWNRTWGTPGVSEVGYGITYGPNGNIWVTGNQGGDFSGSLFILKYDSSGNLLLSNTVSKSGIGLTGLDIASDNRFAAGAVQGIYVAGYSISGVGNSSIILFKFRADTGDQVWNTTFNYGGANDRATTVISTYDSSVAAVTVGGYVTDDSSYDENAILLRYDRDGNLIWHNIWGDVNEDERVEDLDYANFFTGSFIYGCGFTQNSGIDQATFWVFNNDTGTVSSVKTYTSAEGSRLYSIDVISQIVNGDIKFSAHLTGYETINSQRDILFMKVSLETLTTITSETWDSGYEDEGRGVAASKPSSSGDERYVVIVGLLDNGSSTGTAPREQILIQIWSQDLDGDGLTNMLESMIGTSIDNADTDGDGMPDGWEYNNGLNATADDSQGDLDNDGVPNIFEYGNGTLPTSSDTDNDGMDDLWEITNLLNATDSSDAMTDPDGDGVPNIFEYGNNTLPQNNDTDGDGMPDGWEISNNINPIVDDANSDPDNDGVVNIFEYGNGTLPQNNDTDSDRMSDGWELEYGFNPTNASDAFEDLDSDGLLNVYEFGNGTLPNNNDTDDDGMPDYWEVTNGLNPTIDDAQDDLDNDGVSNIQEYLAGTDPDHDEVAPVIASVSRDPAAAVTNQDTVVIYIDAQDHNGIATVYVMSNYTGTLVNYTATYDSDAEMYKYSIPAADVGETITYKIYVEDVAGNWASTQQFMYTVQEGTETTSEIQTNPFGGQLLDAIGGPMVLIGIVGAIIVLGLVVKIARK